jgi:hypothetical protein
VLRGLVDVDPSAVELMRSYAASDGDDPAQGPDPERAAVLLTAMKVATTLSLIGAIVGEYFGARDRARPDVVQSASALKFESRGRAILSGGDRDRLLPDRRSSGGALVIPWHAPSGATLKPPTATGIGPVAYDAREVVSFRPRRLRSSRPRARPAWGRREAGGVMT